MLLHELLSALDIHLLAIGREKIGQEWNYPQVTSYYNRLILPLRGTLSIHHHGTVHTVSTNQLHLIPCYTPADYACEETEAELIYLHFTARTLGGLDLCKLRDYEWQRTIDKEVIRYLEQIERLNPRQKLPVINPDIPSYRTYHEHAEQHSHDIQPALHLKNSAYISLLLAPFLEDEKNTGSSHVEGRRMFDFAQYVEANLHRPLGVNEVAEALDVTPNYLSDWLYGMINIRPLEYMTRRRIEEAQLMLISTQKGIKEIAYDLGFTSPTYFARVFRRELGMTASEYRNRSH